MHESEIERCIDSVERLWPEKGKSNPRYNDVQRDALRRKLRHRTQEQLAAMLEWLIDHCKFRPELSEYHDAAVELGFESSQIRPSSKRYEWEPTSCKFCAGEGLLRVIMLHEYNFDSQNTGKRSRRFIDLGGYSDLKWFGYKFLEGYTSYVFRCCCSAGDLQQHPTAWPKWQDRYYGSVFISRPSESKKQESGFKTFGSAVPTLKRPELSID